MMTIGIPTETASTTHPSSLWRVIGHGDSAHPRHANRRRPEHSQSGLARRVQTAVHSARIGSHMRLDGFRRARRF